MITDELFDNFTYFFFSLFFDLYTISKLVYINLLVLNVLLFCLLLLFVILGFHCISYR